MRPVGPWKEEDIDALEGRYFFIPTFRVFPLSLLLATFRHVLPKIRRCFAILRFTTEIPSEETTNALRSDCKKCSADFMTRCLACSGADGHPRKKAKNANTNNGRPAVVRPRGDSEMEMIESQIRGLAFDDTEMEMMYGD